MKKILSSILITIIFSGLLSCTPKNIKPETNIEKGNLIGKWNQIQIKAIYFKNGKAVDSSILVRDSSAAIIMDIDKDKISEKRFNAGITNFEEVIYSYTHFGSKNRISLVLLENNTSGINPINREITYKFINGQLEFLFSLDNISERDSGGAFDKFEERTLYNRIP